MKKSFLLIALAAAVLAPCAMADNLTVVNTQPMEGNFYLSVDHISGSGLAYVEDRTPTDEKTFRSEFLFRMTDLQYPGTPVNIRQPIFVAFGNNPNPGVGACSQLAFVEVYRIFLYQLFGGQRPGIQAWARGNQCGPSNSGVPFLIDNGPMGLDLNGNGIVRICSTVTVGAGPGQQGNMSIGVIDETSGCGQAVYQDRALTNDRQDGVTIARMATAQQNQFGAGETGTFDFDSYASFRTELAP
ncbi:MAG: hypothetical protein AAGM22_04160 [Acidobacteriota bacterium]